MDEISPRETMEPTESARLRRPGGGGPAPHRINPARVSEKLASGTNAVGFARLDLMVNTIFERLLAGDREPLSDD
jgi:hypothetical protein